MLHEEVLPKVYMEPRAAIHVVHTKSLRAGIQSSDKKSVCSCTQQMDMKESV